MGLLGVRVGGDPGVGAYPAAVGLVAGIPALRAVPRRIGLAAGRLDTLVAAALGRRCSGGVCAPPRGTGGT